MTENIGIRLNEILSQYVDLYLAEAETENYPYAVYTCDVTPVYTKDGIHHYQAVVTITVYAKDLDEITPICNNIKSAMDATFAQGEYSARITRDYPDCLEGVWSRVIDYTIIQY